MDQQCVYLARGSATYVQPNDLLSVLAADGPHQAALPSLER
jgi:hypothetical protein